ncbi:AAA family ATPase [Aquicoccus sp. SU-CL01552]|uniref:AAA family ATPase n=1 Tax=Aquicoccus sp. SU-CL01552 TaxID=3127656 RepID=UPI003105A9F7
MDILSIKGENIASLAKPFEIDLEQGDLAGCGLFAITGNTGAGKSSLLDAICLALYGNCPRLGASGVRDTVPDASGDAIQSDDPRTLLRRGAAAGHAIVRFRGKDGVDYEASWSVRRAYGRPTGNLQAVDRSITRLSDGQVLENQLRRVNERVVELTGLTYEEFRRSVLLAQGDFDSFLSARTSERAAILEKVTGTGLYREISRRVYAGSQAAERAVEDLAIKFGEHTVLGEERKAEIAERQGILATLRKDTRAALKRIQADLDHYAKLDSAKQKLSEAMGEKEQAQKAWQHAEADRAHLARLRKAASIRAEFTEERDARATQKQAQEALDSLKEHLNTANEAEAQLRQARTDAQTEVDRLENRFKEFGPIWSEAERLDANITTEEEEHKRAIADVETCRGQLNTAEQAAAEKRATRDRILEVIETRQATIDAETAGQVFETLWDVLHDRLGRRIKCAATAVQTATRISGIEKDIESKQKRLLEIDKLLSEHGAKKTGFEATRTEKERARSALAARDPAGRLTRLITSEAGIRNLQQTAQSHATESAKLKTHDDGRKRAEEDLAQAELDRKIAQAAHADAETRIRTLEVPVEMAEAAISTEARSLRRHLVDGEPCPVCQSTHHPVHDDELTAELARSLREDLEQARRDRNMHSGIVVTKTAFIEEMKARLEAITGEREALEGRIAGLVSDYAETARMEADGPVAEHVPQVIDGDVSPVVASLVALRERMGQWRAALEGERDRLSGLEREIEELRIQIQAEETRIGELREERAQVSNGIAPQEKILAKLNGDRETAESDLRGIDAELDSRIGDPAERGLPSWDAFGTAGAEMLTQLEVRRATHMANTDTIRNAEIRLADLRAKIGVDEAAEKAARETLRNAEKKERDRRKRLEEMRRDRGRLLDGQPTGTHRTAFNASRRAAIAERDRIAGEYTEAAQKKSGLEARKQSAQTALETAGTRLGKATDALRAASAQIEIPVEELASLLSYGDTDIAALAEILRDVETRMIQAEKAAETRARDLEELDESHSPEEPHETLEERKAQFSAQDETHAQEEASLSTELALDAEAHRKQAEIVAELEKAKQIHETWAAVNDAVGSSSGDRFSQIAQEVTLAILVEQANHHLAEIKPRYRLALGEGNLSIHVVDEDMAGEIRSTRSLSGGERFLVSLALALALSSVGGAGTISGTLFIDEGFGTLDTDSLELAIDALEALQAQGRTVGVISHVQAMKDRIPIQIQILAQGDGSSEVVIAAA